MICNQISISCQPCCVIQMLCSILINTFPVHEKTNNFHLAKYNKYGRKHYLFVRTSQPIDFKPTFPTQDPQQQRPFISHNSKSILSNLRRNPTRWECVNIGLLLGDTPHQICQLQASSGINAGTNAYSVMISGPIRSLQFLLISNNSGNFFRGLIEIP